VRASPLCPCVWCVAHLDISLIDLLSPRGALPNKKTYSKGPHTEPHTRHGHVRRGHIPAPPQGAANPASRSDAGLLGGLKTPQLQQRDPDPDPAVK